MTVIYRNNQNRLFTQLDGIWNEIIHPESAGCEESIFEELIKPKCEFIYPQRQSVSNVLENFADFPELNTRVIALEVIDHLWVDVESGFLLGIEGINA